MIPLFLKKHRKFFSTLSLGSLALALAACNSGGGSDGDLESQTAPRTLEGIELTLYEGGPVLGFRRTSGSFDTEIGSENGLVFMVENPGSLNLTEDTSGDGELDPNLVNGVNAVEIDGVLTPLIITPAPDLGNVTYTYNRIESRVGEIFIQGNGQGPLPNAFLGLLPFFHSAPRPDSDASFEHRFRVEFGSTGLIVDNITVRLQLDREAYVVQLQDNGVVPNISQASSSVGLDSVLNLDASIQLLNGNGPLFVGYDPTDSAFLNLNPIFPIALDGAFMAFSPVVGDDILTIGQPLFVRFLQSSFTPELSSSSFEETGTVFDSDPSSPTFNDPIGSYNYSTQAAEGSDFRAGLTMTLTNREDIAPAVDTEFTIQFVTQSTGDYTNNRRGSGRFSVNRFLVLDQFGGGVGN